MHDTKKSKWIHSHPSFELSKSHIFKLLSHFLAALYIYYFQLSFKSLEKKERKNESSRFNVSEEKERLYKKRKTLWRAEFEDSKLDFQTICTRILLLQFCSGSFFLFSHSLFLLRRRRRRHFSLLVFFLFLVAFALVFALGHLIMLIYSSILLLLHPFSSSSSCPFIIAFSFLFLHWQKLAAACCKANMKDSTSTQHWHSEICISRAISVRMKNERNINSFCWWSLYWLPLRR